MDLVRPRDIVEIAAAPGDKAPVLDAADRLADTELPHDESLNPRAWASPLNMVSDRAGFHAGSMRRSAIERGESVSTPLKETNVFPSMVVQMINVGETTGALDAMLSKIADFYEDEVDSAVAGMLTLMEPVMIAFLGVVVGGIVIAMYLPIFDLISQLA